MAKHSFTGHTKRLLEQHEKDSLVRYYSVAHNEGMTDKEIKNQLKELGEFDEQSGGEMTRQ